MLSAEAITRQRAVLAESPLWDDSTGLRWIDVERPRLFTLRSDGTESSVQLSAVTTCIELGPDRQLLAVTRRGFGLLEPDTGHVDKFVTLFDDVDVSMNDGAIDERGRCWAGSAVRDGSRRGALFRLEGETPTIHVDHVGMSNGIDWSPSGDWLYHVDTAAGTVTAFEYHRIAGELGDSHVLTSIPADAGLPDGLAVDEEGGIWLALWGRGEVHRLHPETGQTTMVVRVPTPYVTSCTFGGSSLSTLFITTASYKKRAGGGLVYAVELPVRGKQPNRFAGVGA